MDHATFRNRARTCRRADGERSRIDPVVHGRPPGRRRRRHARHVGWRVDVPSECCGVVRFVSPRKHAHRLFRQRPQRRCLRRANFVPSRNDYAYDIRRLHTIDYTLCLAARHNDHRAACERVIALGQKGAIDLRRDLAHRRRLSSIGCNVLGN